MRLVLEIGVSVNFRIRWSKRVRMRWWMLELKRCTWHAGCHKQVIFGRDNLGCPVDRFEPEHANHISSPSDKHPSRCFRNSCDAISKI